MFDRKDVSVEAGPGNRTTLIHRPTELRVYSWTRYGPNWDRAWRNLELAVLGELGGELPLSKNAWKALREMRKTGRPLVKMVQRRSKWGIASNDMRVPEFVCWKHDVADLAFAGLIASNGQRAVLTDRGRGWSLPEL